MTKHASVLEEASVAIVQCEIPVPVLAEVADVCVRHGGAVVALDEAARVAVQAGAIAVTRPGARTGFRPARS